MFEVLKQPYPALDDTSSRLKLCIGFSLFVFLFLLLFQPFGITLVPIPFKFWAILGYGTVCFTVMILCLFPAMNLFPDFFDESKWNVGKEIFWTALIVTLIANTNFLYSYLIGFAELNIQSFVRFFLFTVLIGIFPITAYVLVNYIRLLRLNLKRASVMTTNLQERQVIPAPGDSTVKLMSDNGKEY